MSDKKKQQYDPYKIDRFAKIPSWIKAVIFKFWMAGAFYFFIGFSGVTLRFDFLDIVVFYGMILGLVTEYLINGLIKWMNTDLNPTLHYRAINTDKLISIPLNIIYTAIIVALITWTYEGINMAAVNLFNLGSGYLLPGEPFSFGVFYVLYDSLWLLLRKGINYIIKKNKKQPENIAKIKGE